MKLQGNSDIGHSRLSGMSTYSHAYIIWGGSEADRTAFADNLAQAIICSGSGQKPCMACAHCAKSSRHIHPDIIAIDRTPDTRAIYVDQIRALREDAVIMPNEAQTKVYIIGHAGSMNVSAQNAILKLLEEPPESSRFILITENPAELLPTVRSRCVERAADSLDLKEPAQTRDDVIAFYAALTGSPLKLTEYSFVLEKQDRNEFIDFVDGAKAFLVLKMKDCLQEIEITLSPEYLMKAVTVLDRAKEYFENNVSLGHISGMICAELIRNEERYD